MSWYLMRNTSHQSERTGDNNSPPARLIFNEKNGGSSLYFVFVAFSTPNSYALGIFSAGKVTRFLAEVCEEREL